MPQIITAAEVSSLNSFPQNVPSEAIDKWILARQGELFTMLRLRGFTDATLPPYGAPVSQVRADFLENLRLIVMYGAAAMVESAPPIGHSPDEYAAAVASWLSEYARLYNNLAALTLENFVAMGLIPPVVSVEGYDLSAVSLGVVRHASMEPRPATDFYPWRLIEN
jgi:hypothetical protein